VVRRAGSNTGRAINIPLDNLQGLMPVLGGKADMVIALGHVRF
jgi:hypothetical protein